MKFIAYLALSLLAFTTVNSAQRTRDVGSSLGSLGSLWRSLDSLSDSIVSRMSELSSGVHIQEDTKHYIVMIDVPGISRDEITVTLSPREDYIHIRGNHSCSSSEDIYCLERQVSSDLRVPPTVETKDLDVVLDHGVLYITFTKSLGERGSIKGRMVQIGDRIKGAFKSSKETIQNVKENVQDKARDLKDNVQNKAADARDSVWEKANEAQEAVEEQAGKTKEQAKSGYEGMKDKVTETYEKIKEKLDL